MNAIELLVKDHRFIEALFTQIQTAQERPIKKRIFYEIKNNLELHKKLEEQLIYPSFVKSDDFEVVVARSFDSHTEIQTLLEEANTAPDMDDFDDIVDELTWVVQDHFKEEEGKFFPKLKTMLSEDELVNMGSRLIQAKSGASRNPHQAA